jgi:Flp pilus assembly protein CpaB
MTSLSTFLRAARSQFTHLLHALIRSLHRERTSQLVAVVISCSLVSFFIVESLHSARSHRHQWASNHIVLVARGHIAMGDMLTSDNTTRVELPMAIIATDALTVIPRDARVRIAIENRTALTSSMISLDGERIALPAGWRGIALPADLMAPQVRAGDHVDVISADQVVAANALIIEVSTRNGITIGVPAESAAIVATAVRTGDASLVIAN